MLVLIISRTLYIDGFEMSLRWASHQVRRDSHGHFSCQRLGRLIFAH